MVTVAILAILAALAAPSFNSIMERWRARQATEELQSTLYYARSEAIKRGGGISLVAASGWAGGWTVKFTQNAATTDLQVTPALSNVDVSQSGGQTTLYVDRWGMLSESATAGPTQTMSFVLKPTGKADTDASAIRLCVSPGGRLKQQPQGAACPT